MHTVKNSLTFVSGSTQGIGLAQLKQIGAVEILINNAGIFSVEDFFKLPDEEWHRYYQTNVMSLVRLCRALMLIDSADQRLRADHFTAFDFSSIG